MDYYERIQNSIDFIELHLKEEIDLVELANQAYFSVTHFYRVFQAMVGDSVKEYIRKRKLSNAGIELLSTDQRLIDVAFEYGFESQEVFTRAFSRAFGITPGRYRKQKNRLYLFEKANVKTMNLKDESGGVFMEPKIIFDKEFKIVGIKAAVKPGSSSIADLWGKFGSGRAEIRNPANPEVTLGLCEYMPNITEDSEFNYCACVEVNDLEGIPEGMTAKTIPPSKYAVFTHKGSMFGLKNTFDFIYGTWFPESGYELAERDTIEWYDSRSSDFSSPDYAFDIYIPLK
ncbi:MAG: AraC family transcriptional regulator [Clostridia bacterium]|nr:AraC family transcriptional regulator [Clostridia bacterium]